MKTLSSADWRTHSRFNQYSSWPSNHIGAQSFLEDPAQNPRRYTDNIFWGDNVLFGCARWRTVLLHIRRLWKWDQSTDAQNENYNSENAVDCVENEEPFWMETNIRQFVNIDETSTSYFISGIKASARIRVEQNVDLYWKNWNWENSVNHMLRCYYQQTDSTSTTKRTRVASSSKMACCSKGTTEKVVVSNTTQWSYQKSSWKKKYGACTESLASIPQSTKQ